ncbi:DUF6886 family protein [Anaerobacillus isosaccharinicus]|uniref:Uncharacterized protein n=1 Tax=Anaerobacillus isosaccharinicus TaxID=1532552 RepID=A0A1S2LF93_9BACI|nr:DUF6886 family protein [Anaerobacillus isosaccharinicus]MBA5586283.1 hypothetical protein [Anaerobacillus isosaccharinicus]QOY35466.1 hypothetical protein AWH56_022720 [Anaerobacillus isosaccharinicus]
MRLFHVSEESDIQIFVPRLPVRKDLDQSKGLVWAINETCLPNFLTPRDCPRVTYHCNERTTEEDKQKYLSSQSSTHVIAIEHQWFEKMKNTTLYLYEFDPTNFYLQDRGAGYYVSEVTEIPINKIVITDVFAELINRNIEVRMTDQLWDLCECIQTTSFDWSICRMGNAKKK